MSELNIMFTESEIQSRIKELAEEIDEFYNGESIVAVCVLKGAIYFATDLTKRMKTPMDLEVIRTASYNGTESTGVVKLILDLDKDIKDKNVLIIEDIIDTGYTMKFLKEYFQEKNPRSLKVAILADKKSRRKVDIDADFVGFDIEDKYIVGYGFDENNKYRNLPYIGSKE